MIHSDTSNSSDESQIVIYYVTSFSAPKMHLTFDEFGTCQQRPAKKQRWQQIDMIPYALHRQVFEVYLPARGEVTFVFSNSECTQWDNPDTESCSQVYRVQQKANEPTNYRITHPGRYVVCDGYVLRVANSKQILWSEAEEDEQSHPKPRVRLSEGEQLVISTDLDGTLVHSEDRHALKEFKKIYLQNFFFDERYVLVYATGRTLKEYLRLQEEFSLLHPDYLIASCGTELYEMRLFKDETQREGFVSVESFSFLLTQTWSQEHAVRALRNNLPPDLDTSPHHKDVIHVPLVYETEKINANLLKQLDATVEQLRSEGLEAKYIISGTGAMRYIDVLPCDKGDALRYLCEEVLRTPIEHSVAFGDSCNDCAQLERAGRGIIVKNMQESLLLWYEENQERLRNVEISVMPHTWAIMHFLNQYL